VAVPSAGVIFKQISVETLYRSSLFASRVSVEAFSKTMKAVTNVVHLNMNTTDPQIGGLNDGLLLTWWNWV